MTNTTIIYINNKGTALYEVAPGSKWDEADLDKKAARYGWTKRVWTKKEGEYAQKKEYKFQKRA